MKQRCGRRLHFFLLIRPDRFLSHKQYDAIVAARKPASQQSPKKPTAAQRIGLPAAPPAQGR
jgi:hypothetical protein